MTASLCCAACGHRFEKEDPLVHMVSCDRTTIFKVLPNRQGMPKGRFVAAAPGERFHMMWNGGGYQSIALCGPLRPWNEGDDYVAWAMAGGWS
jgi:hypothetical protein